MSTMHGSARGARSAVDIVDAQLHLTLALGIQEAMAAMDALSIAGVMLDELWGRNERDHGIPCVEFPDGAYRPISPYAQAAALRHPERFSFVQRITRRDPQLALLIPLLASSPGCRSLRIVLFDPQERQLFAAGGYDALLGLAQAHGLPLCVLAPDAGALLATAMPRFPDLHIVIDHCGWVKTPAQWNDVLALARQPNCWLKWSHAARAFRNFDDAAQAAQREFTRALDAFGVERVLWAGDASHEESKASWRELLSFVHDNPALSEGDRQWVLGKTARRVFRWPAG